MGFTFPYVSLTVQSALRGLDPALEQASRSLGRGARATFVHITLPQLRPAIGAGALLVALYVLSDFGAVSLLRYSTFTRAIYLQYQAAFDRTPAALLGLVLIGCTAIVLLAETWLLTRSPRTYAGARAVTPRRADVVRLGGWRGPALLLCSLVVLGTLAAPLLTIGYWLSRAVRAGADVVPTVDAAWRSIGASAAGAVAATVAAAPVAILATRYRYRAGRVLERLAYAGHALPGIVGALALVFFGARFGGPLYQTLALLVFAYVVLFLPQALGAIRASLLQVPPHVEEAARGLGSTPLGVLRRVVLPIARRGALSGAALVFLTCMKELPATLLLAPSGFDTLATEIWAATTDASFARAALPAVVLIALGALPLALIVVRERELARE